MSGLLSQRMANVMISAAFDHVWRKADEPESWVCQEPGTNNRTLVGPTVNALIERGVLAERPYRVEGRIWAEPTEDGISLVEQIKANGGRPPQQTKPPARPRALNAAERDLLTAMAAGRELLYVDHFWHLVTEKGTGTRAVNNGRKLVKSLVERGYAKYQNNSAWLTGAKLTAEGETEAGRIEAENTSASQNTNDSDRGDQK